MAESLLTEDELKALTEGIDSGDVEVDTGLNVHANVVKHDLTAEDSTLGVNLTSIDMVNERFIRLFRLGLLDVLRTSPRVNYAKAQIMKFGEYLKDLKPPLSVTTIKANPLRGAAMVLIEPDIIFCALDNFFGGFGKGIGALPPGRLFTPTENRIIRLIHDQMFLSLREAWSPLIPLDIEVVGSEINPQFAQIVDENDLVILSRFETEIGKTVKGFIDIVYPYNAIKPYRELLGSRLRTSGETNEDSDQAWLSNMELAAGDVHVDARVELANVELRIGDFDGLEEGQTIFFKKPDFARLLINDVPVYEVAVGKHGVQAGIRIENPIKPEESND